MMDCSNVIILIGFLCHNNAGFLPPSDVTGTFCIVAIDYWNCSWFFQIPRHVAFHILGTGLFFLSGAYNINPGKPIYF